MNMERSVPVVALVSKHKIFEAKHIINEIYTQHVMLREGRKW